MKKFSTAALILLFVLVPQAVAKARCEFLKTAPDVHRVKAGDTLWQIAATFLENPWCWSVVWQGNRDQIRDPHWIYPGQTIYFDRERQQLSVRPTDIDSPTRRSPEIRTENPRATPLPLIAPELGHRLDKTSLLAADALTLAPTITRLGDGRRMAALGDTILVSGSLEDLTWFQIIRPMQTIADPDTGKPLALAGLRVGAAYLLRQGPDALHQFRVVSSDTEILIGDRLVPSPNRDRQRWLPHPAPALSGRVAAVLRGATWASMNDVIAINRGLRQGLDAGSVVAVVRPVKIYTDARPSAQDALPPEKNALMTEEIASLLVFDVADEAALAVVMRAKDTFTIGESIQSVDRDMQ